MGLKLTITSHSTCFNCSAGMNSRWHPEISEKQSCYLPYGKPMAPHLHRWQGFAVGDYSCTLDALHIRPTRRLQDLGLMNS